MQLIEKKIIGYDSFIEEIQKRIYTTAIITITNKVRMQQWDINKDEDGKLHFGTSIAHNILFPAKFMGMLHESALVVILRSFTTHINPKTNTPIKELRGYEVWLDKNIIKFRQISAVDLASAYETDAQTGEHISPEKEVLYYED